MPGTGLAMTGSCPGVRHRPGDVLGRVPDHRRRRQRLDGPRGAPRRHADQPVHGIRRRAGVHGRAAAGTSNSIQFCTTIQRGRHHFDVRGEPARLQRQPQPVRLAGRLHGQLPALRTDPPRPPGRGGSPDADAVLRVEPEPVAVGGAEHLVELVEVAHDVGAELRRAVRVDGEVLQRPAPCGAWCASSRPSSGTAAAPRPRRSAGAALARSRRPCGRWSGRRGRRCSRRRSARR